MLKVTLFKSLLDPSRLQEYDTLLKYYCEVLNRWSLFNKRIEFQEYLNEIAKDSDEKFGMLHFCFKFSKILTNDRLFFILPFLKNVQNDVKTARKHPFALNAETAIAI